MFRPQEISATEARKYFSQIINKVQFGSKSFVVKSYRRPAIRIVKEQYIAALEQVLGKKTIGQVLEVAANDNLPEFAKIDDIKKIFQRRLSGSPQQQPKPRPQPQPQKKQVAARPASPPVSKPQQTKPQPKPQPPAQNPKSQNPTPQTSNLKPPTSNHNRGVLLLSNGKSYE